MAGFGTDPVVEYAIGACNVQLVAGETRVIQLTNLYLLTGTTASDWVASIPSRGVTLAIGTLDTNTMTVTFGTAASAAIGQQWVLQRAGHTVVAGQLLPAPVTPAPAPNTIVVTIDADSDSVPVSAYSVATRFRDMTDVDWSTPPTNHQLFVWNSGTSKLIPITLDCDGGHVT